MKEDFINNYSKIWDDNPLSLMKDYIYLLDKTKELDELCIESFNKEKLYEIVLWKLNRFPEVSDSLIDELKKISMLKPKAHRDAKELIKKLVRSKGIALPMASTILRFINPSVFQIIDDRVFRIVFPDKIKYAPKPQKVSEKYLEKTIELYFDYIDRLHQLSSDKLPFDKADRIIYQLDILLGNKIGD